MYKAHFGAVKLASKDDMKELLKEASESAGGQKFSLHFLLTEWEQVVEELEELDLALLPHHQGGDVAEG